MPSLGYRPKEVTKSCSPQTVPAATTEQVVSEHFVTTYPDSVDFVAYFKASSVTLGAGEEIVVKLQEFSGEGWHDVGDPQACFLIDEGDGEYCIKLDEGVELEALVLPLTNLCRFVITTGATSTVTIDKINHFSKI